VSEPGRPRVVYPPSLRSKRRYLHPLIRYGIVAALGVVIAGLSFYVLRRLGY
jgi:hypothetical protein